MGLQVHDIWHTIFDLDTTVLGELALKWVEAVQTRLPMCMMSAAGAPVRLPPSQRQELFQVGAAADFCSSLSKHCTVAHQIIFSDHSRAGSNIFFGHV